MNEHITPDELSYHASLIAQLRAAQAAWQSWSRHMAEKYALGPGDSVAEDGTVVRAEQPDPSED